MTPTMTPEPPSYEIYAVKFGENPDATRGQCFYGAAAAPSGDRLPLDYFVWLIRSEDEDIVVDTGFSAGTAARRGRTYLRTPREALGRLGVRCDAVPCVVLSHLHYDHAGGMDAFPAARFVVQEAEVRFWTGRHAQRTEFRAQIEAADIVDLVRHGTDGRIDYVRGERQIRPGVRVHHVGGHTAGMQVVSVETAGGTVVLASDACHVYPNVELTAPAGIVTDLPAMYDALDTIRALAGSISRVVPGHDPQVLQRFPQVHGEDGVAVRIA